MTEALLAFLVLYHYYDIYQINFKINVPRFSLKLTLKVTHFTGTVVQVLYWDIIVAVLSVTQIYNKGYSISVM